MVWETLENQTEDGIFLTFIGEKETYFDKENYSNNKKEYFHTIVEHSPSYVRSPRI